MKTVSQLITAIESNDFQCQGGPLTGLVEWKELKAHVSNAAESRIDSKLDEAAVKILEDHGVRGKVYEIYLRRSPHGVIADDEFAAMIFNKSPTLSHCSELLKRKDILRLLCDQYYNTVISRSESES